MTSVDTEDNPPWMLSARMLDARNIANTRATKTLTGYVRRPCSLYVCCVTGGPTAGREPREPILLRARPGWEHRNPSIITPGMVQGGEIGPLERLGRRPSHSSLIRPNSWYGIKSGCWGTETCRLNAVPGKPGDVAWFMGLARWAAVTSHICPYQITAHGRSSAAVGRGLGPESRFSPPFPSVRYCDVPE